jgi:hypothetical protein
MMAVLYMVGDGLEEPLQAKRLLDLELFPKKPHFAKVHTLTRRTVLRQALVHVLLVVDTHLSM